MISWRRVGTQRFVFRLRNKSQISGADAMQMLIASWSRSWILFMEFRRKTTIEDKLSFIAISGADEVPGRLPVLASHDKVPHESVASKRIRGKTR